MAAADQTTSGPFPTAEAHPPEDPAQAPPVVVVMVTHEAGPWLEESLASLGAQDYPNLSVLVIDAGSADDPLPRVAAALPSAFVRRLDHNPGFGAAANEVLHVVEGASFYAFCHDDVLLEPHSIRALVEEAYRSNAGIVGPKLVSWGAPDQLLQVGLSADKTGVLAPLVERHELDQEQHDAVRDVFTIPGGCTLVRADLFSAIGGFDPAITVLGEDLDLCWRAQVAGARVVVVPAARVHHREALDTRRPVDERRRLLARHRLRTVLTCYGPFHLARVLPQALLVAVIEAVYGIVTGRFEHTRDIVGAWTWNLGRLGEVRARRRILRGVRQLPDAEVRRLQVRGSARVNAYVRGELGGDRIRSLADVGRGLTDVLASGHRRFVLGGWLLVALLLVIGTRKLVAGSLPVIAGLAPFDTGPFRLLQSYLTGWWPAGIGGPSPAPTAVALLGVAGLPLLGAMGTLQQLLVVGMLPLGVVGVWRLTAGLDSRRARVVGLIVYATVPLPYDALARGGWGALLVYGAAPWILRRLLVAARQEPFAPPPQRLPSWWREVLGLGIVLALLAAFVPVAVVLVVIVGAALVVGGGLAGGAEGPLRALGVALGAVAVAVVLHVPWSLDLLVPGSEWNGLAGIEPLGGGHATLGAILRFDVGRVGLGTLGWGFAVAAALPLLIGRGWRFTWASRLWLVAVATWALAWWSTSGRSPLPLPSLELLLAPGAAAVALAAALGMVAFERDLPGYRFGWRQLASLTAGVAVVVGVVPVTVAALDGRWGLPDADLPGSLTFMADDDVQRAGGFRVLWVGRPGVLPVGPYRLDDHLVYGVSRGSRPDVTERWSGSGDGAAGLLADALRLAADGQTDRLGRLLAPFGIRYVVVPSRAGPDRTSLPVRAVPEGLRRAVGRQLDLRRIEVDPAVDLYENAAWAPVRSLLPDAAAAAVTGPGPLFPTAAATDLAGAEPVLDRGSGHLRYRGEVAAGTVYLAEPASAGWQLTVGGEGAPRTRALGWANAFTVDQAGDATLRFRTSPVRWLAVAVQAGLWILAARALLARRAEQV